MKNIINIILSLLLLVSCTEKADYNVCVTGTVKGGVEDGDSIYLMQPDDNNVFRIKGRTVVLGGSFVLTGKVSLPSICDVVTTTDDGRVGRKMKFIAEGGDVTMSILPDYYRVSGSPLNDALQQYRDSMEIASKLYNRYYSKKTETPTLSQKGVEEADNVMAIASYQYRKVLYNAIEKNNDNILAAHLIKENVDIIEPSRGLSFIKKLSPEYKDNVVAYINKMYEAQEKSAVGARFMDFSMRDINGSVYTLSDYAGKGKTVLLSVSTSSDKNNAETQQRLCELCKQQGEALEVVNISVERDYDAWRSSVGDAATSIIQLSDLKGWNSAFLSLYGVDRLPYYILLDGEGVILYRGTSYRGITRYLK